MTKDWNDARFETRAIHAGQDADPTTGAVITPIYQTSTYAQDGIGNFKGYEYSRTGNPTRTALQEALASLEGGAWGLTYASGLAATQNIAYLLRPGDHVLLSNDTYGGTFRLFDKVLKHYGIEMTLADLSNLDEARGALQDNTKMVWVETPTNPYLRIVDIAGWAEALKGRDTQLVVDNTFASPYLQQPLSLGADLVLHSTTKYVGGHSDVVGGAVIGNDEEVRETLAFHQNAAGAVPGPFDSWLTLRGIKTLGVRMDRHSENATQVAEWLVEQDAVETVYYPGLASHPNHEIAAKQMKAFSGMVSFTVKGGFEVASKIVESTRVFTLAESLGGVESLIEHPGKMTHASVAGTGAEVEDSLIRLSVGIEHVDDQIADLEQALAAATSRQLIGATPSRA
ncbi:MAG TPA: cystathionine gamma-synthase [Thermomicrobiales bacterium]|nr:cystathionine gamma-synthase [Thermomicrobiales bacterium]